MKQPFRAALIGALLVSGGQVAAQSTHALPFFPSADSVQQGFARIVNRSGRAGTVRIYATDDAGEKLGPFALDLAANEARSFNSQTLEARVGDGEGHWWLELHTGLDIAALAYIRVPGGFVTSMYDVVEQTGRDEGNVYWMPFFNPASNTSIRSVLRIVNPNNGTARVRIEGQDSAGSPAVRDYSASIPPFEARAITSRELEEDFGDGHGKWQLWVHSDNPLWIMNLLQTRSGHLSNLSSDAPRLSAEEPLAGTPPVPSGMEVNCGIGLCFVGWDSPASRYDNHKSTWIYRSRTHGFETSERVGTSTWIRHTDENLEHETTYHYWIRWESTDGVLGPHASASGTTAIDPDGGPTVCDFAPELCEDDGVPQPRFLRAISFLTDTVVVTWSGTGLFFTPRFTHIYRNTRSDFSSATHVGAARGISVSYTDRDVPGGPAPAGTGYWYWAQFEDQSGARGEPSRPARATVFSEDVLD